MCYPTPSLCSWKGTWACGSRKLNKISICPKYWKKSTLDTESPQVAFKMKARASFPFQLQSFYEGFPPATCPCQHSCIWEGFLLVSARQTIAKAVPHSKSPKPWTHVQSPTETWVLKGRRHTSACLLTYSVFPGGESCTVLPTGEWWRWSQNQLKISLRSPDEGCDSWNHSFQPPYPVEGKQVGDKSWDSRWVRRPLFQRSTEKH